MISAPWEIKQPKPQSIALLDPELRRRLIRRSGGLDEVTGERLIAPPECHHRIKKSQGRDDSPSNLLVVSRKTHDRLGQHEAWAKEHGFTVFPYGQHARDVAIVLHLKRYVLLDDAFNYIDAETGQLA